MIDKIIKLLEKYTFEYEEKAQSLDTLKTKISLYDELIPLLNDVPNLYDNKIYINILLTTIYNDYLNDVFYQAFYALKQEENEKYDSLLKQITFDFNEALSKKETLSIQLINAKYLITTAKKSVFYLRNRWPLFNNGYTFKNIRKIISYYTTMGEIDEKEEILLLNELEYYNRNIIENDNAKEKEYANIAYNEVPSILNSSFEMYDEIEVASSRKGTIMGFVTEIKSFIEQIDKDEIIPLIEEYKKYNLEDNEYAFIVNEILKFYLFKAIDYYELLLDSSIYEDRGVKNDAIITYYQMVEKYLVIRKYYHEITDIEVMEDVKEETIIEKLDDDSPRKLVFSHPAIDPTKAKFIMDIKDIKEEYYQTTLDMINSFLEKKKKLKPLTNNRNVRSFWELKNDQIRIIIKHVKDNIFCITGVFIKKSNNNMKSYRTMCNRIIPDISSKDKEMQELELGKITMDSFKKIVEEKARKGTR